MRAVLVLMLCQACLAQNLNDPSLFFPMDSPSNLEMFNGAELRPGIKGNALYTDGVDDYASLGDLRDYCIGDPDLCEDGLTLSFWLKIGMTQSLDDDRYYLSSGGQTRESYGLAVLWQKGSMLFIMKTKNGDSYSVSATTASDWQDWNQITFSWSADNGLKVYLNGALTGEAASPSSAPVADTFNDFTFGKPNNGEAYSGEMLMDELCIWNIEQPSEFISAWYSRSSGEAQIGNLPMDVMLDDDTVSGDYNLDLFNGAELRTGIKGNALYTDGTDDYASLGDLRDTCFGNPELCENGFTLSFWLKLGLGQDLKSGDTYYYISNGGQTMKSYGFALYYKEQKLTAVVRSKDGTLYQLPLQSFSPEDLEAWNHITITFSSDNGLRLYANGKQEKSTTDTSNVKPKPGDSDNFDFGKPNNGEIMFGRMLLDDLWFWDVERADSDVDAWYNSY